MWLAGCQLVERSPHADLQSRKLPWLRCAGPSGVYPHFALLQNHKPETRATPPAPAGTEVSLGSGSLTIRRGTYVWTSAVEGLVEPVSDNGEFVELWKKQSDGTGLMTLDIWNSDMPPGAEGGASR